MRVLTKNKIVPCESSKKLVHLVVLNIESVSWRYFLIHSLFVSVPLHRCKKHCNSVW